MRVRKVHYYGDNALGLSCHTGTTASRVGLQVTNEPERVTCNVCNWHLCVDQELANVRRSAAQTNARLARGKPGSRE